MYPTLSERAARFGMKVAVAEGALFAVWTGMIGGHFLTGYLLYLGASTSQIGLIAALGPLSTLSMLFAAYLLALLPRRKPFMVGTALWHRTLWSLAGFVPLVLPRGTWVWTYLAVYFAAYLGVSLAGPAWQSMMADMVPGQIRGRYLGLRNAVVQVASILTVLVAGRYLDAHPGGEGFRTLYAVGLPVALLNVAAFVLQPEPPYVRQKPQSIWTHLAMPLRSRPFVAAALFGGGLAVAGGLAAPFYGVRMIKDLQLSYGLIATISSAGTAAGILGYLAMGRIVDRVGERTTLGVLPVLTALVPLTWLLIGPRSYVLLYGVTFLSGVLGATQALAMTTFSYAITPRQDRPVYLAVFSAASGLGGFVAPIVGGWVEGRFGFTAITAASAAGYILLALYWHLRVRPLAPGNARGEAQAVAES